MSVQSITPVLHLTRPHIGLMILALLAGVALGVMLGLPPVAQNVHYHAFHDGRAWLGIPNAANVLSNMLVLAIPVLIWAFPSRYTHGHMLLAAIGCYVVAKVLEDADGRLFALGEIVSGHSLKHLAAATGAWCIYRMLAVRKTINSC